MEFQALLVCGQKNSPPAALLFEKVAGLPLLLRNILALNKAKFEKIGVVLPASFAERFEEEIAPGLEKRNIDAQLITYSRNAPVGEIKTKMVIPAHALIETKLKPACYALIVDDLSKIKTARKRLTETIRLATPGPVARYFNKRLSIPISLLLSKHTIHPNWITLVNMLFGMGSGYFIAQGTYASGVIGAVIFQMASVFDGCDGEVAKLTYQTSKFGQYFDSLSDNGALVSFFIGLVFAYAHSHPVPYTLGLAALLLTGLGGLLWQMIWFLKKNTQSASLATFDKEYLSKLPLNNSFFSRFISIGKTMMRKDYFSMFFLGLALIGKLPWILYVSVGSLWIANAVLIYLKLQTASLKDTSAAYE